MKWSKSAKLTENHDPGEYFALKENRYTSEARDYRKTLGLPEIEEYEGLTEEEILKFCKKADDIKFNKLPKNTQFRIKMDKKINGIKSQAMKDYWQKINYLPMGTGIDYDGEKRDTIDHYLKTRIVDDLNSAEKLDFVRNAIDLAEQRNILDKHPELYELEEKYKKEVEEQGLEEIVHIKKQVDTHIKSLKYNGEEGPWAFTNCMTAEERLQDCENKQIMFIDDLKNYKFDEGEC